MCEECGAPDKECASRFNEFLAKEFEDPRYGRVHNLTVCTFMLQHSSRLTREGWLYERDLLREFLVSGKLPDQIRHEAKDVVDSGKRTFKIKSRIGQPVIPRTKWARTALNVRLKSAEEYCRDVMAWATATLADSEKVHI